MTCYSKLRRPFQPWGSQLASPVRLKYDIDSSFYDIAGGTVGLQFAIKKEESKEAGTPLSHYGISKSVAVHTRSLCGNTNSVQFSAAFPLSASIHTGWLLGYTGMDDR